MLLAGIVMGVGIALVVAGICTPKTKLVISKKDKADNLTI